MPLIDRGRNRAQEGGMMEGAIEICGGDGEKRGDKLDSAETIVCTRSPLYST